MKIVIAGAGIAGNVLALSLHAAGFDDVTLYERSREIRGLGVGLNLQPHGIRELIELGVEDAVRAIGVEPSTLAYYNRFGQAIWSEPRGTAAGYQWPQLSIHRGRLQVTLADLVRERMGDVIRTGHRLAGVEDVDGGVIATFETENGPVRVEADLLVGADGIRSALRTLRYPEDGEPVWNGLTLWRGTALAPSYLDGRTMVMIGDDEQKFVAYPLEAPRADGLQLLNFIAEKRVPGSPDADWNHPVPVAPIVELFADWDFDWFDVPATIAATEELLEYPMVDRNPLPRWSIGRSTLVGDAAHAMYPNGSNGGSQAILDARTLAYHLATAPSVEEGLEAYDDARRPAMAGLLAATRQTGPEKVMILARERAPEGFEHIHDVIPAAELEQIAVDYKKAAGFHPSTLNERSSLSVRREG